MKGRGLNEVVVLGLALGLLCLDLASYLQRAVIRYLTSIRMASEDVTCRERMDGESERLASTAESRVSSDCVPACDLSHVIFAMEFT